MYNITIKDENYSYLSKNLIHGESKMKDLEFDQSDGKDKVPLPDYLQTDKRPIGELIQEYASMRDMLKEKRRDFKEFEAGTKSDMELLEVVILEKQRELGVTSLSTKDHTAFQTKKVSVRMGNWDTFSAWVLETKNIQCLEKRCAKLACLEVEEEGTKLGDIGVDKETEICVQVRKK